MPRAGAAFIASAILLSALAGSALGAPVGSISSAKPGSVVVPAFGTAGATASCPKGTRALSGGFSAPEFDNNGRATVRYSSTRAGKRSWRVEAAGLGDSSGPIVAHAYCQKPPLRVRVARATTMLQPNSMGSVTATCRKGEQAIGGGFGSPQFELLGGAHSLALGSHRAGRRAWRVEGFNPQFDESTPVVAGDLSALAFCRRGGPRVFARSTQVSVDPSDPPVQVDSFCPQGSTAVSGGFDGHIALTQNGFTGTGAVGSMRLPYGSGWRTQVVSVSDQPSTGTGYAYCQ